jgi:hypothetical protein
MPSPFPGMNPFLEQDDVWQDFHDRYIPALSDALSPQVSPQFFVKIEEHLFIHEPAAAQRHRLGSGDVNVSQSPHKGSSPKGGQGVLTAPARIVLPSVEFDKQTFLEIRDRQNRQLVTVIELLSPSNKRLGADRDQYRAKRANLLRSMAHLVEIDLLRGGPRLPLEKAPDSDYYVMVSRAEERPIAEMWPLRLRDALPVIPIPLRPPWPDARLDLQEVLHAVYDRAYYKDYIYDGTPQPPLNPDDGKWAKGLMDPLEPPS